MRNISYQKSVEIYLGLIAFVICAFPKLITLAIIGLAIFTISGFVRKKIVLNITLPVILLALLYLVYLTGTIFSQNHYLSDLYIENKLTFLVFPLFLSFRFKEKMDLRPAVAGLISGITIVAFLGFINAMKCSEMPTNPLGFSCYTSSNFSYIHHPSYYSVYILIALFSIWHGYLKKWKLFNLWWMIPFSVFLMVIYCLCLSLAGYLFLFLLAFILVLVFVYHRFGKKIFIVSLAIVPVLSILIFASIPQIKSQFITSKVVFLKYLKNPEKYVRAKTGYKQGDDTRVIMWTVSSQEFADHLFGVGTGNVDLHLSRKLNSYGQVEMARMDENGTILYNPHNQFLQTGLEIGIQGLLLLLLIMITAIRFAFKHKNWILLLLVSSLFFNSLFESMLQRQSGILFYAFWLCLLVIYSSSRSANAENTPAPEEKVQ